MTTGPASKKSDIGESIQNTFFSQESPNQINVMALESQAELLDPMTLGMNKSKSL